MSGGASQTPLDFCREVMGWERPVDRSYGERERDALGNPSKVWTPYIFDFYGKRGQFHYTDLNAVMAAVREWCDANDGSVELAYYGYIPGEWEAQIGSPVSTETIVHADPCQALVAACLEAARRLKAT